MLWENACPWAPDMFESYPHSTTCLSMTLNKLLNTSSCVKQV